MSALKFWVWLTEQNRLGGPARQALLEHFGSPEEVYYAEPGDLLQVEGITADQAQALVVHKLLIHGAILLFFNGNVSNTGRIRRWYVYGTCTVRI